VCLLAHFKSFIHTVKVREMEHNKFKIKSFHFIYFFLKLVIIIVSFMTGALFPRKTTVCTLECVLKFRTSQHNNDIRSKKLLSSAMTHEVAAKQKPLCLRTHFGSRSSNN